MDQANFQESLGHSAPVPPNRQQGDDPDLSLTLARGFYWGDPIATINSSQAADNPLLPSFVQPRHAGLPLSPPYTCAEQSHTASLSPVSSAGFSGFVQPRDAGLPLSPVYTDFEQFLGPSLSPVSHVGFSGFVQPRDTGLPLSPVYTDFEQYLGPSLIPMSYVGFSGFVQPRDAGLSLSPEYTDFEQSLGPSLSPMSYAGFSDFVQHRDTGLPLIPASMDSIQCPSSTSYVGFSGFVPPPAAGLPSYTDFGPSSDGSLPLSPSTHAGLSAFVSPPTVDLCSSQADSKQSSGTRFDSNHADYQSCARCRQQKKKCIMSSFNGESCCVSCARQGIPASVCIVVELITPFQKCLKKKYSLYDIPKQASGSSPPKTVQLGHYRNGPTLTVKCRQFSREPNDIIKTSVLRKNEEGCHSRLTTAWCLEDPDIDISPYIQDCVPWTMAEACTRPHRELSPFFKLARDYNNNPSINLCWLLFTIFRSLRIGWQFSGKESLGMVIVKDKESVFYGFKHVPRMLRDQLNHKLESKMMELDEKILKDARDILENGKQSTWVVGHLILFFLLHIREVFMGRIFIWEDHYTKLAKLWLHIFSPTDLIKEVIASCNDILLLFRFSKGPKLLRMNWDNPQKIVGVDSNVIKSMRELQAHAYHLRDNGFIGRMARDVFKAGNPNSVDLTVFPLIFESTGGGYEVKGFC